MFNLLVTSLSLILSLAFCMAYANEINDPTKPTAYRGFEQSSKVAYQLESILLGHKRKVAIINGQSFSEGDTHKLGKVISIDRDKVIVQGAKRHILTLTTLSFKKPVDQK